jgi:6-phosphogluconolactonase (cycloisomerase 2 family)
MKFSKSSQLFLVSVLGLIVASLLAACQLVTVDYVFVAASAGTSASSAGEIYTYAVDSQSGALRTAAATVSSGGTSPVAMAVSSDYYQLYVINQGNNSVVHFSIATNGVLTQKDSITLTTTPVALAVNEAGTYLYVVSVTSASLTTCNYMSTSTATLTEYSLSSGTIGSAVASKTLTLPSYTSDIVIPTGVVALANNDAVYVSAYDKTAYNPCNTSLTTSNANPGWVFGFAVGSGGALTASTNSPYQAGTEPNAITADPTSSFVYATDYPNNEIIGYLVQGASTNYQLYTLATGPVKAGNEPTAVTIDPRGLYVYVVNSLDNSVSAYSITKSTGSPSTVVSSSSATSSTDTQPMSIVVEPSEGRYVYTANYLGNSISGFRLDPSTGALTSTQATPYPTGAYPRAIIAVPHGNHSIESVTR